MRLNAETAEYDRFLAVAGVYWAHNVRTPPTGDAPGAILVEALHQDIRVTLRNLTVANALRRIVPARLILYTGTDQYWDRALWTRFDVSLVERLGKAYGADAVIDVHRIVDERIAGTTGELRVAGRLIGPSNQPPISDTELAENIYATTCRLLRVPRLSCGCTSRSNSQSSRVSGSCGAPNSMPRHRSAGRRSASARRGSATNCATSCVDRIRP